MSDEILNHDGIPCVCRKHARCLQCIERTLNDHARASVATSSDDGTDASGAQLPAPDDEALRQCSGGEGCVVCAGAVCNTSTVSPADPSTGVPAQEESCVTTVETTPRPAWAPSLGPTCIKCRKEMRWNIDQKKWVCLMDDVPA